MATSQQPSQAKVLKILPNFSDYPLYRIFGRMYEALNIDKK
jgi:hypothetical protein